MPFSASWMPREERCHSAHSSWKRAWATPCHSLWSGATWPASWERVDSMFAAPALSCDATDCSCSGVTAMLGNGRRPPSSGMTGRRLARRRGADGLLVRRRVRFPAAVLADGPWHRIALGGVALANVGERHPHLGPEAGAAPELERIRERGDQRETEPGRGSARARGPRLDAGAVVANDDR